MRLIVMFDLPVGTPRQRSAAARFRNDLLKDGYTMMQYSIYVRLCKGVDAISKHRARLLDSVPAMGAVRMMVVTEKQYADMEILLGELAAPDKETAQQIRFY